MRRRHSLDFADRFAVARFAGAFSFAGDLLASSESVDGVRRMDESLVSAVASARSQGKH
jgi:hypothetical protein